MSPAILGFAFEVSPVVAGIACLLLLLGGLAAGKLLWQDDRALMQDRREAGDLAKVFAGLGFTWVPKILTDFSIGDQAQTVADIKSAASALTDPAQRAVEFAKLLKGFVEDQLTNSKTAQVFLDDVVAFAEKEGYTPSKTASAGQSDDGLLDSSNNTPPVAVHVYNSPTATEAAAGKAAMASTVIPAAPSAPAPAASPVTVHFHSTGPAPTGVSLAPPASVGASAAAATA